MAKYVGHIFKVNNAALKVKGTGTHYVHVKWYNPFKKTFYCKVITSLEHKIHPSKERNLKKIPHRFNNGQCYAFSKQKYKRLRDGKIVPIPINDTEGFEVWSGYEGVRYLSANKLKGNKQKNMRIKNKKAR